MRRLVFSLLLVLFLGPSVVAVERFELVTTNELHQLLAQRDQGLVDFVLINTLDKIIADDSTIPGSINLPWSQISANLAQLGDDPGRLIITYCMGYR